MFIYKVFTMQHIIDQMGFLLPSGILRIYLIESTLVFKYTDKDWNIYRKYIKPDEKFIQKYVNGDLHKFKELFINKDKFQISKVEDNIKLELIDPINLYLILVKVPEEFYKTILQNELLLEMNKSYYMNNEISFLKLDTESMRKTIYELEKENSNLKKEIVDLREKHDFSKKRKILDISYIISDTESDDSKNNLTDRSIIKIEKRTVGRPRKNFTKNIITDTISN